jgi:hypothetical protein
VQSKAELPPQRYDYSYQLYQEDDERIRIEAYYLRGQIEIDDATSFRFQWLSDAISGSSPNGALPGGLQPFYSNLEDVRIGILGAISRQFGDHKVELEISRSREEDYLSHGFALSDTLELNQKNTTLSYGLNFLNDLVIVPVLGENRKYSYDWFTGVSQIIDKDTVVSANLTLGFSEGYLNDQYKVVQRTDTVTIDDGNGGTIILPVDNLYRENRPDNRFRQVLQLEARRYIEPLDGVIDGVLRLSHDDYGVFSQTVQIEWRQSIGENFQVIPFIRYYHQNAADFFVRSLDGLPIATPAADPDGSGINYSADYRLSSFNTLSGGVRLRYKLTDNLSASAAYECYVMSGIGSASERSPEQAYSSANIWTFGISAEF